MSTDSRWQWNFLPSVILIKILSYLPLSDIVRASSTCKAWRTVLFYPKFWEKIKLTFKSGDLEELERSKFIATYTARKLKACTLIFESVNSNCLLLTDKVLIKLTRNSQLEEFILLPTHCHTLPKWCNQYHAQEYNDNHHNLNNNKLYIENEGISQPFEWCSHCHEYSHQFIESASTSLHTIVTNSRNLRTFVLGCLQDLSEIADELLPLLARHQHSLSTLGLASVKSNPNTYALLHITPDLFKSFSSLQVLTVDYDYVNDELLQVLSRPLNPSLRRFVIHVHGIDASHRGTSEVAWHQFSEHNSLCSLIINLIHSYEGVEQLHTSLLRPSMPLAVLRSFFCQWINLAAIRLMSSWYSDTLLELQLIDALHNTSYDLLTQGRGHAQTPPDPLVMLAWRCKSLRNLTLIGYGYSGMDLVAISRLRGAGLKELVIPEDCIESDGPNEVLSQEFLERIVQDVSAGLGRSWKPLSHSLLHQCLQTINSFEMDEFILPTVLKDGCPFDQLTFG